jgi:hypothetical protein
MPQARAKVQSQAHAMAKGRAILWHGPAVSFGLRYPHPTVPQGVSR